MRPIAIFYHCLFCLNDEGDVLPRALQIVNQQMEAAKTGGLVSEARHFCAGINGEQSGASRTYAGILIPTLTLVFHGLASHAENLTIVEVEKWAPDNPGWNVLYFHAKGCTHPVGDQYGMTVSDPWREAMMQDLVLNWRQCVSDLDAGYDIACSHWLWNMCDGTQHIPAGNFLWVRSEFVAGLPSIYLRDRIKTSGIAAAESRYEAEVYWGNGPRRPNVKQYRPNGGGGVP